MKLLFDEARKHLTELLMTRTEKTGDNNLHPDEKRLGVEAMLDSTYVIKADNIADYFSQECTIRHINESDHEISDLYPDATVIQSPIRSGFADYPSLAPPFPFLFIEYQVPQLLNSDRDISSMYAGVFIEAHEYEDDLDSQLEFLKDSITARLDLRLENLSAPVRWALLAYPTIQLTENGVAETSPMPVMWIVLLDQSGATIRDISLNSPAIYTLATSKTTLQLARESAGLFLEIALLTIAFTHCKNIEHIIRNSPEQRRGRRKRYAPKHQYHMLCIKPKRKVYEYNEDSGLGDDKIKKRLHICRGHFRDYSEGGGLFGKLHGIYWVTPHARGSFSKGTVSKDYSVDHKDFSQTA